jgi:hypothetical protein
MESSLLLSSQLLLLLSRFPSTQGSKQPIANDYHLPLQFPLLAIASVLILWKVHLPPSPTGAGTEPSKDETWQHKLQRIDWLGCLFVVLAVRPPLSSFLSFFSRLLSTF